MIMTSFKPGKYRHYKGNMYEALFLAKNSETCEETVIYRALYDDGQIWARPLSMWNETVEHEGVVVPRFEYIG